MTTYTRYMTPYDRAWDMGVYTEYMWSYDGICQGGRIPDARPGPGPAPGPGDTIPVADAGWV